MLLIKFFIESEKDRFISAGSTFNNGRELNMRTGGIYGSLKKSPGWFWDLSGSYREIFEELRILSKVFWIFFWSGRGNPWRVKNFLRQTQKFHRIRQRNLRIFETIPWRTLRIILLARRFHLFNKKFVWSIKIFIRTVRRLTWGVKEETINNEKWDF